MTRKRLDRDLKWYFQGFPYYQMRVDTDCFHGFASLIQLLDGEYRYWEFRKAGSAPVCGKDMVWLQLLPDDTSHCITAKFLPDKTVSVWYVDVIEGWEYEPDGVIAIIDKYLDVVFTPQGDIKEADRDELDAAYHAGELTKKQYEDALSEGKRIMTDLCSDIDATHKWCRELLAHVESRIETGEGRIH